MLQFFLSHCHCHCLKLYELLAIGLLSLLDAEIDIRIFSTLTFDLGPIC